MGFAAYIETSAATGQNIANLFETITKHLFVVNGDRLSLFVSNVIVCY